MATAISNHQFARSLFDPMRQSVGRFLDTQLTAVERAAQERRQNQLANLRRLQEIEDRISETETRERLVNLSIGAQKDIEESRAQRDQVKFDAALSREDARASEAERKARIAATRDAFAKYQAAGGSEKIEAFGPEDSPETFYRIQNSLGQSVAAQATTQFRTLGNLMRQREQELSAITELLPQEESELAAASVFALAGVSADHAKAARFYEERTHAAGPEAALELTRRKFPAFSAALDAELGMAKMRLRKAKAESPAFVRGLQAYQADRAAITKAALESPYGSAFLETLKDPTVETRGAPQAKVDFSNLRIPAPANLGASSDDGSGVSTQDLANLVSPRAIVEDQGFASAVGAVNPAGAAIALSRQLAPIVARRIPAALATADRTVSNIAASLYNLRPVSMDRGLITRAGESAGTRLANLYASAQD